MAGSKGRLDGRVALVTGAASGIGAACALRFAQEGAIVAGFDVQELRDGDWDAAVSAASDSSFAIVDVRDEDRVSDGVAKVEERFGHIDVLANCAGVAGGGPVHLLPTEEWDRIVDINLKGTYLVSRFVMPGMVARTSGSVINIASIEGIEGFEGGSAYNASKGGVVLLTKNMALDYGRKGIRVNAICPGFIETPLFDSVFGMEGIAEVKERIEDASQLGRFGRPVEIANAALFLASDEASYVSGHSLVVDGGYTAGHRFGVARMMGLE
jgi:NAD(P)-dependent dehydrogenase (short-subunit alcohol dehydrogenase family)